MTANYPGPGFDKWTIPKFTLSLGKSAPPGHAERKHIQPTAFETLAVVEAHIGVDHGIPGPTPEQNFPWPTNERARSSFGQPVASKS